MIEIKGNIKVRTRNKSINITTETSPIGKERIVQQIENLKIDDINAFVDGLNNLNQVKQVLKQILYIMQIPKEQVDTFTINKGLKNDRLERRQNKNH